MAAGPDQISKTFCSMAFTQLHVSPIGIVKPCCIFDGAVTDDKSKAIKIADDKVENIWNCTSLKNIRKKMLNGETVDECRKCMEEESAFASSDRIRSFDLNPSLIEAIDSAKKADGAVKELPNLLNLKIGNICNSKCRMCQPLDSCAVDSEFTEISKSEPDFRNFENASAFDYYYADESIDSAANWITTELGKENLQSLIKNTVHLSLAGGETTFTPEAIDLLKYCVDQNLAPQMGLTLSTNLTRITDEFINLIAKFKFTTVVCSIDGVGPVNEYIRYAAKWKQIEQNFIKLKEAPAQIIPFVAPTIQIYNILDVVPLLEFIEKHDNPKWEKAPACHLTILFTPQFLSIRHLPVAIKMKALEKIESYIDHSKAYKRSDTFRGQVQLLVETLKRPSGENAKDYLSSFLKYTEVLDKERSQRMADYLPELAKMFVDLQIRPEFPNRGNKSFTFYKFRDNGFKHYENKEYEKAERSFDQAYVLHKDDPDLLFSMGLNYLALKNDVKAKDFFKLCLQLNPKDKRVRPYLKNGI